jgi:hypothetical protein
VLFRSSSKIAGGERINGLAGVGAGSQIERGITHARLYAYAAAV